jgi:hypothetical protein
LLARQAPQGQLELQARRDRKDQRAIPARLDQLGHKDPQALQAPKARQGRKATRAQQVHKGLLAQPAQLVLLALQEPQAPRARPDHRA